MLAALAVMGCSDFERTNPYDQKRCDPACDDPKVCYDGKCEDNPCPGKMVHVAHASLDTSMMGGGFSGPVAPFCIDRWEASGQAGGPAKTAPDVLPLYDVSAGAAHAACRLAGKQLCTREQWLSACIGPNAAKTNEGDHDDRYFGPIGDHCHFESSSRQKTGAAPKCEGGYDGIFDMVGNVSEWVMECSYQDCSAPSLYQGGSVWGGGFNEQMHDSFPECQRTTEHMSMEQVAAAEKNAGFRCCLPCDAGACKAADRFWFDYSGNRQGARRIPNPQSMWGRSDKDIWAVGLDSNNNNNNNAKVLHFDGTSWSEKHELSQCGMGDCRISICATSADEVFIAYNSKVFRSASAGLQEETLPLQAAELRGIWCTESEVWVGGRLADQSAAFILHLAGDEWKIQWQGGGTVEAIWGTGPSDIWAVGHGSTVLRYNGSSWAGASTSGISTDDTLTHVWGTSTTDVWIVGQQGSVYRLAGSTWTSTDPQGQVAAIGGSDNDVWAIVNSSIKHYEGSSWVDAAVTLPGDMYWAIWSTGPKDVWFGTIRYF